MKTIDKVIDWTAGVLAGIAGIWAIVFLMALLLLIQEHTVLYALIFTLLCMSGVCIFLAIWNLSKTGWRSE